MREQLLGDSWGSKECGVGWSREEAGNSEQVAVEGDLG